ncbi:hypothetical protein GGR57DRAFT_365430 [Xylariaceae sp. FL1272]|nr:hypothetical protein GGR57DRAFT_365430 [Xylariaceae sp. FL1272]
MRKQHHMSSDLMRFEGRLGAVKRLYLATPPFAQHLHQQVKITAAYAVWVVFFSHLVSEEQDIYKVIPSFSSVFVSYRGVEGGHGREPHAGRTQRRKTNRVWIGPLSKHGVACCKIRVCRVPSHLNIASGKDLRRCGYRKGKRLASAGRVWCDLPARRIIRC